MKPLHRLSFVWFHFMGVLNDEKTFSFFSYCIQLEEMAIMSDSGCVHKFHISDFLQFDSIRRHWFNPTWPFFMSEALKSAWTLSIVCSFWFVYDYCCFEKCLILFNALNMLSLDNCTFCYLHIGLKLFLAVVHFLFDVCIFPPVNLHACVNLIDVHWCCVICYSDKCNVKSWPYETHLGIEAEFSQ